MRFLFVILVLGTCGKSMASELPINEVKAGLKAVYYVGHLYRQVNEITQVYSDGEVEICDAQACYTRKIKNIGIQTKDGCLLGICKGDEVKYSTIFEGEQHGLVLAVFDNNIVQIDMIDGNTYRQISKVSKVINP